MIFLNTGLGKYVHLGRRSYLTEENDFVTPLLRYSVTKKNHIFAAY